RCRGDAQGEPRLSRPARPGKSHEAHVVSLDQLRELRKLPLTPDERACLRGKVRVAEAAKRWEVLHESGNNQLKEPFSFRHTLDAMLAQIAQLNIGAEERGRCPREQHLAAVAGGADPRSSVDIDSDVALVGNHRFTRVDAYSHAHRATRERALRAACPRYAIG